MDHIFPIVEELNFKNSKVIYWLFKLRGIPVPESLTLTGLENLNFVKLETRPGREMILGLIGQFWTVTGRLRRFRREDFTRYHLASDAKATWSFELVAVNKTLTTLCTETRVFCPSKRSRLKFRIYWTIVKPFSTWIRREILRSIKRQAETRT